MLYQANAILLPLESVLSKDVSAMNEAMARERETKMEVSPIHGQAIYQSYGLRVRETCQSFKPLVPSLTFSVQELHSLLTRLARTASLHAGNLHKVKSSFSINNYLDYMNYSMTLIIPRLIIMLALSLSLQALEGLGESQEVKSQGISLSRPDLSGDATESDERGGESISTSGSGSPKDLIGLTGLSLQDKEWISPPDSIGNSSVESSITSTGTNLSDGINDPAELMEKIWLDSNQKKGNNSQNFVPSSQSNYDEPNEYLKAVPSVNDEAVSAPLDSSQPSNKENLDVKFRGKDEASTSSKVEVGDESNLDVKFRGKDESSTSSKVEVGDESHEVPGPNTHAASRIARGECKI